MPDAGIPGAPRGASRVLRKLLGHRGMLAGAVITLAVLTSSALAPVLPPQNLLALGRPAED